MTEISVTMLTKWIDDLPPGGKDRIRGGPTPFWSALVSKSPDGKAINFTITVRE